ncbi:adenosylcobinamide-phosphate synthase CbiB [Marinobacter bohaiensis]|uniref:adenosylcobinamide-phosphate synthase CbiB n=1 Tax=Marinobacter bohaiensis TaxID=2201898 RepID=UPI000DAEF0C9|nr:adenosylcobinamide-phosphate synthase CbiB [Marinobacter bohaiensis]
MIASAGVIVVALLLDHWLGEPRRGHPVVLFGGLAARVEASWNREPRSVARGAIAACLLLVPVTLLAWAVSASLSGSLLLAVEAVALWLCLSLRGLAEHGRAVRAPLERQDIEGARKAVGRIVSRDTRALDETGVATAATESMLENGADAVFASLFWYLLAGLPGVLLHRMVNTLDAMWGYRNERFNRFGRFAARLDDAMNYLPARLTALTYALVGRTADGWRCWREQGKTWESPNAGPVMAAGAGALHVNLGGPAPYSEGMRARPRLGVGPVASAATIGAAIGLVYRGVVLWVGAVLLMAAAG